MGQGRPAGHERRAVLLWHAADRPPAARAAPQRLSPWRTWPKDHPELRTVGIAAAYTYAAANRQRYAEFFERDGSLAGPGYSAEEAAGLPEQYRLPGVVVKPDRAAKPATAAKPAKATSRS